MNHHHTGIAIVMGRICKQINKCEEAVDYIEACLEEPSTPRSTRMTLHFTAGKILDRLDRYDEAFAHYRAGNDLVTHLYDAVGNAQLIYNLIKTFTPAFFMGKCRASISDKQPIFIVGMPRSGTSLTEQILASHPQVYGAGELLTMTNIIQQFRHLLSCTKPFPACIDRLQQEHVDKMASQYIDHITQISGSAEFVTDKFPHNFYALGLIQLLCPNAKIIHCRRDPMDTGLSIYFQNFFDEHDYAKDLFNIGIHYHQYKCLMEHWKQSLSIPILEIDYEELVTHQEAVTRRMLAFCGLEWDPACLDFHRSSRHVSTASYEQVRQPIYSKSIGRWKHYEKHLGQLLEGLERGC
jgi:tetratricopeptide (TPR) repeat protein